MDAKQMSDLAAILAAHRIGDNERLFCPFCDGDVTNDEEIRCSSALNIACPHCGRLISRDQTVDNAIVYAEND